MKKSPSKNWANDSLKKHRTRSIPSPRLYTDFYCLFSRCLVLISKSRIFWRSWFTGYLVWFNITLGIKDCVVSEELQASSLESMVAHVNCAIMNREFKVLISALACNTIITIKRQNFAKKYQKSRRISFAK